jgi:hypothetical protein
VVVVEEELETIMVLVYLVDLVVDNHMEIQHQMLFRVMDIIHQPQDQLRLLLV